jgi:hypothetical protein
LERFDVQPGFFMTALYIEALAAIAVSLSVLLAGVMPSHHLIRQFADLFDISAPADLAGPFRFPSRRNRLRASQDGETARRWRS